jgi:hypothetical protein
VNSCKTLEFTNPYRGPQSIDILNIAQKGLSCDLPRLIVGNPTRSCAATFAARWGIDGTTIAAATLGAIRSRNCITTEGIRSSTKTNFRTAHIQWADSLAVCREFPTGRFGIAIRDAQLGGWGRAVLRSVSAMTCKRR